MPRTGRGGSREGAPGARYPQRTDLNENRQPVRAVSTGYGTAKQSEDAQRIAPLPAGTEVTPPAPSGPASYSGPQLPPLGAPTERPGEPITAGLPTGPGPGPEALGLPMAGQDLARLAAYLPVLEIMASRPDSSEESRNFVRLVRASIPTGA